MSKEFIQHRIYPTKLSDYKKNPKVYNEDIEDYYLISLPEKEMYDKCPVVLILPKNEYHSKTLLECCLNIIITTIPNIRGDASLKKHGVHNKFMLMLHALSRVLGYLVNCTSWEEQKVYEFDTRELNHRLDFCKLTPEE